MTLANVLLVDDEQPFVETMSKRLRKRNIYVCSAHSGVDALGRLETDPQVEVVVLDVKMPGMDGIETLQAIRRRFPLIEVVMLTGHATVESAIDGMKLGAFDYLMKPCDMDHLLTKVTEAAARKRKQEEKIIDARIKEITARRA
jgi:DNA-binding NtrC family response regulator